MPTTQAIALLRYNGRAAGCLQRATQELGPPTAYQATQFTNQYTVGVQHQLGSDMAFSVDYLYNHGGNEKSDILNINLTYDPTTGVNLPYSTRTNRPFPGDGTIGQDAYFGWSNLHSLNTSFNKRLSHHWQGAVNYSLSGLWSASGNPLMAVPGKEAIQVPFKVADDLTYPYGFDSQDQRPGWSPTASEIWKGFQLSGYHYFAGNRSFTNYGGDVRNVGTGGQGRLRPTGRSFR